jgi:nicotinate-nucleotide adenylyltransferase
VTRGQKETEPSLRIGLLGGTFDPPHLGHLWLAETARAQLQLDRVLFLPVGQPPHKTGQSVSAAFHRLAMTGLAVADNLAFVLDATDVERAPPHTTHTLIPLLQYAYPLAQMWLLLGADSLADLPQWRQPKQLLSLCRLAVLHRPGVTINWQALKRAVPGLETAVDFLDGPSLPISSTEIRQWARLGYSLRYLAPTAVASYIEHAGLYTVPRQPA